MPVTSVYYGVDDAPPSAMLRLFSDTAKYALNEVEFSDQRNCEQKLLAVLEQVRAEGRAGATLAAGALMPVIYVCHLVPKGEGLVRPFLEQVEDRPEARASVNSNDFRAVYVPAKEVEAAREELEGNVKIYAHIACLPAPSGPSKGTAVAFAVLLLLVLAILLVAPKSKPSLLAQFLLLFLVLVFFVLLISFAETQA